MLDSFIGLDLCSSASKSHCVKPEADGGHHFGSLNGSAFKDPDNIAEKSRQPAAIGLRRSSNVSRKPPLAPAKPRLADLFA